VDVVNRFVHTVTWCLVFPLHEAKEENREKDGWKV
jgi:hypothetical protein